MWSWYYDYGECTVDILGGKTQEGFGKWYVYVFAESNQNKHMTPTQNDSTTFRHVSGTVSTNDAKNKNKF